MPARDRKNDQYPRVQIGGFESALIQEDTSRPSQMAYLDKSFVNGHSDSQPRPSSSNSHPALQIQTLHRSSIGSAAFVALPPSPPPFGPPSGFPPPEAPRKVSVPKLPKGKIICDFVVPMDVDTLFQKVFLSATYFKKISSKSFTDLKNYSITEWGPVSEGHAGFQTDDLVLERRSKYDFSKVALGKTVTISTDQLQFRQVDEPGHFYTLKFVSQSSGVIYSDTFRLILRFRILREDLYRQENVPARPGRAEMGPDSEATRFQVVGEIDFFKQCFFKSMVESESWNGLKKFYDTMEAHLTSDARRPARIPRGRVAISIIGENPNGHGNSGETVVRNRWKGHRDNESDHDDSSAAVKANRKRSLEEMETVLQRFRKRENILFITLLLVLVSTTFVTLAMFKLASSVNILSEKVLFLEEEPPIMPSGLNMKPLFRGLSGKPENT